MAERLVKIAKELNAGIASIIEFLGSKGHLIENRPTAMVSDEIISILRHEFKSYMHEKDKAGDFVIGRKNEFNEESKLETNEKTIREPIKTIQRTTDKALWSPNVMKLASIEQKVVQAEIQETIINNIDLYDKPEHELFSLLKRYLNTDSFSFIGRYKINKDGNTSTFENIRDQHGDLLYFPVIKNSSINGGGVKAFSDRIFNLIEGEYYQFTAEINPIAKNINKNPLYVKSQPFGHVKDNIKERLEKEALVKTIFKETIPNLTVSSNQANSIKKVTEDAYEEDDRFVFELIQNADDSGADGKNLDCSFTFINNYLLVQHNGQVFTDDDVKAITGIGHSSTAKMSSLKKTGYKGIGFKAVFIVSDNVGIISGDYSFEFSKYHRFINEAGYGVDNTPWEILPIWFQRYRLPRFLYDLVKFDKINTNFVIEIKENQNINSDKVKKDALNIFSQPQFCLFLRHISKIHLKGLNEEKSIEKIYNKDTGFTELLIDKNQSSTWLKWVKEDIHITADVTKSLKDDSSIPDKLKKARSLSISFAAKIEDDRIVALNEKESVLFTYLPTTVRDYQFPFLVNADFLTILNRQSIKQGKEWNKFIFEKIAYSQFLWAIEIWNRKDQLSKYCLNIIKAAFNENEGMAFDGFNQGFYKALDEISFIPDVDGNLCNICDIIIDTTGLSKIIGIEKFYKVYSLNGSLLGEGIENTSWLKLIIKQKFPSNYFDWDKCITNIISDGEWLQNPEINGEFLNFIMGKSKLPDFFNVTFVLDNFHKLSKPSEILIEVPTDKIEFLTKIGVKVLHPEVLIQSEKLENTGLKKYDGASLITNYIIPNTEKINEIIKEKDINLAFYQFLFEYFDKLPDYPTYQKKYLQNFCFYSHNERFYSKILKSLVFARDSHSAHLIDSGAIPDDLFCLLDGSLYGISGDRGTSFWEKLEIKSVDTNLLTFINETMVTKVDQIFNHYTTIIGNESENPEGHLIKNVVLWHYLLLKFSQITEFYQNKYAQTLKKFPIISSSGNLKHIEECYILDSDTLESIANITQYGFHFDIIPPIYLVNNEIAKDSLLDLYLRCGAKKFDKQSLTQEIVKFSSSYETTDFEKHKKIVEILIDEFKNENLTDEHFNQLQSFKVRIKKIDQEIYYPAWKCHFSTEYTPSIDIEKFIDPKPNNIQFLSTDYLMPNFDAAVVKKFFKKLGVSEGFNAKTRKGKFTDLESEYPIQSLLYSESFSEKYKALRLRYSDEQIKRYTSIENYVDFKWLDEKLVQKFNGKLIDFLSNNNKTFLCKHTTLTNNTLPYKCDNSLVTFLKSNNCIKNQNGEFKKTTELYSIKLKDVIKDRGKLPADDLTLVVNSDGIHLEELIGIHQDLTHELCMGILSNPHNILGITKLIDLNFFSKIDAKRLDNDTLSKIHLYNEKKEWVSVQNLYVLDEVKLGIGKYPSILHSWLSEKSIGDLFKLKKLTKTDFSPDYGNTTDEGFKGKILEKLEFIAFAEDQDHYEELMNSYVETVAPFEFLSSNRISYECTKVVPPITQTEKQFDIDGTKIYYLRRWNGTFSSDLYKYIKEDLLKLKNVSQKELTDLIQFDITEIIDLFNERNLAVPLAWEDKIIVSGTTQISVPQVSKVDDDQIETIKVNTPPQTPGTGKNSNPYSELEISELERLLSRSMDDSDMANQQMLASFRALKYYEEQGYNVDLARNQFDQAIRKKYLTGIVNPATSIVMRVIPRSAKTGILKLNYNAWMDLSDENTELFVVTGDLSSDILIFKDQKSLANFRQDPILTVLSEPDKYIELNDIMSGNYLNKENKFRKLQFIIRVKENQQNQSFFENFKEVDGSFDTDEKWN